MELLDYLINVLSNYHVLIQIILDDGMENELIQFKFEKII